MKLVSQKHLMKIAHDLKDRKDESGSGHLYKLKISKTKYVGQARAREHLDSLVDDEAVGYYVGQKDTAHMVTDLIGTGLDSGASLVSFPRVWMKQEADTIPTAAWLYILGPKDFTPLRESGAQYTRVDLNKEKEGL